MFPSWGVLDCLIAAVLLLYCASLSGPWFTNEEATEIFPSWVIRLIVFVAALLFLYAAILQLIRANWL